MAIVTHLVTWASCAPEGPPLRRPYVWRHIAGRCAILTQRCRQALYVTAEYAPLNTPICALAGGTSISNNEPLDNGATDDPSPNVVITQAQHKSTTQSPTETDEKEGDAEHTGNTDKTIAAGKNKKSLFQRFFGTRLRLLLTAIATLVIAPAIGTILATAAPPIWPFIHDSGQEDGTQVIFYEPWDTSNLYGTSLSSNVRTYRTAAGYCWNNSVTTNRTDAFRCETASDRAIMDPCFAYPFRPLSEVSEVACPNPGPESVTVIKLTRKLPPVGVAPGNPHLPTNFWLITLADGTNCHAGGGTTDTIGNQLAGSYYYCPGVGFPLYGYPHQDNPFWTILEQKKGASNIEPVKISKVYR